MSYINGSTPNKNPADQLNMKIVHADALLAAIIGEGHESFARLNGRLQDNYLGAVSSLLQECVELLDQVDVRKKTPSHSKAAGAPK